MTGSGLGPFYDPPQIEKLKKDLGITLDSTDGLLNEWEFRKASGLSNIRKYRRQGLITPVGFAMTDGAVVSPHYRPNQIEKLKKDLGITLDSTDGLLNEWEFRKASGFSNLAKYREQGLITPVGYAMSGPGVGPFYDPRQIEKLKKDLGITLDSTEGLLNEDEFKKVSGLASVASYREQGLITPVGYAMSGPGVGQFYDPRQIEKLKKDLGITLDSTEALLNEKQFKKVSGLTQIGKYRREGLITPVGYAMTGGNLGAYYDPRQIEKLRKALGITLDSTEGLLNQTEFMKASGMTNIAKYRKQGLIKPVGYSMSSTKVSAFYHPSQVVELKKKLAKRVRKHK